MDTEVFYRLHAVNSIGTVWSAPGTSFRTSSSDVLSVSNWTLDKVYSTSARIMVQMSGPVPANATF